MAKCISHKHFRNALTIVLSASLVFCVPVVPAAYAAAPSEASSSSTSLEESSVLLSKDQVEPTDKKAPEPMSVEDLTELFEEDASLDNSASASDDQTNNSMSLLSLEPQAAVAEDEGKQVVDLYGTTQYDTAADEALYSFTSSEYAIIANGETAIDALSASALAGALDCPILLASADELPTVTANALQELGVTKPILVGGTAVLPDEVKNQIEQVTNAQAERLWGTGCIDTQLAIFRYGQENNYWSDLCLIAQGEKSFADALSFAPLAYKMKAPIFLVGSSNTLSGESQEALKSGQFVRALVGGGTAVVAEETLSTVRSLLAKSASSIKDSVRRLSGYSLYDTSAEIASWTVDQGIFQWNNAAFATGTTMTDSLAGAAVQARDNSVLLLIDTDNYVTLDTIASSGAEINSLKFFGGRAVVTVNTRNKVTDTLGLPRSSVSNQYSETYTYENIALSLSEFAQMEVGYKVNSDGSSCSKNDILEYMDPTLYDNTTSEFMEFVNIGAGYSGISAETLDAFIDKYCTQRENYYNNVYADYYGFDITSTLRGMGSAIIDAAKKYNINEAYLLAHAIIESDWGCSALSQGYVWNKTNKEWEYYGYLNFFGIGAFDTDPENGASFAGYYGWDSPEAAMRGGASWISQYYIHSGDSDSGDQNTLWKMAWDATAAEKYGNMSHAHQYATGRTWAISIALTMDNLYTRHMGRYFNFDELGICAIIPEFED